MKLLSTVMTGYFKNNYFKITDKVIATTSRHLHSEMSADRCEPWINGCATGLSYRTCVYCAWCSQWRVNREKKVMTATQTPNMLQSRPAWWKKLFSQFRSNWSSKTHSPSNISPLREESEVVGVVATAQASVLHVELPSHNNLCGNKTQRRTLN